MTLSDGALRLFTQFDRERLELDEHAPILIERLLEDGDRDDLRWLTAAIPEARLAVWLRQRGGRRLSRRSRAFWSAVLDVPLESGPPAGAELWPL